MECIIRTDDLSLQETLATHRLFPKTPAHPILELLRIVSEKQQDVVCVEVTISTLYSTITPVSAADNFCFPEDIVVTKHLLQLVL